METHIHQTGYRGMNPTTVLWESLLVDVKNEAFRIAEQHCRTEIKSNKTIV